MRPVFSTSSICVNPRSRRMRVRRWPGDSSLGGRGVNLSFGVSGMAKAVQRVGWKSNASIYGMLPYCPIVWHTTAYERIDVSQQIRAERADHSIEPILVKLSSPQYSNCGSTSTSVPVLGLFALPL